MSTNGVTQHDKSEPSKDEVGWYFVEQYYTTLSKSPEKLHLFYGKKSQFNYGIEAEVTTVSVGRQGIQERIQKLDFQDCKVRISNVDSQSSGDNIVIQVIGETSNKSEEPRKFVQTFVLAKQNAGYFVLNDILRYIKEEEEEAVDTEAATTGAAANDDVAVTAEPEADKVAEAEPVEAAPVTSLDTAAVDEKLEKAASPAKELAAVPVAVPAAADIAVPTPKIAAAKPVPTAAPVSEKVSQEDPAEDIKKPETPKEPASTPAAAVPAAAAPASVPTPAAPVLAEPEKPKEPSRPMTWASHIAATAGPVRPAVPAVKPAAPAGAAARPAAAAAAASATAPASAGTTAAPDTASSAAKDAGSEWQTAGSDSKRQNRPQSVSASTEKDNVLGYVKYVTEKVDRESLQRHLEKFGPVTQCDINYQKNCAFVEFGTPAGYQAAIAANPHSVSGENIVVEARLPKAGAYNGGNYRANRNNVAGRGRGGYENRNGSQGGGRGGYQGPTRGRGASTLRGRGGSQATTA